MAWHPPITWLVDQLVTEEDLNAQIRDNMTYLKGRVDAPLAFIQLNEPANFTTTSDTFVDVDTAKLSHTLTSTGNPLMIGFFGLVNTGYNPTSVYWDVTIDGVRMGGDGGITCTVGTTYAHASFVAIAPTVTAGTHTVRLQWRVPPMGYSATLYTGNAHPFKVRPQFWVREL